MGVADSCRGEAVLLQRTLGGIGGCTAGSQVEGGTRAESQILGRALPAIAGGLNGKEELGLVILSPM